MNIIEVLSAATESLEARRVFAEPYEKDGVTVIPAAVVIGGGGGGTGHDESKTQEGEGGGFGLLGRPVGAYIIKDGQVSWKPVIDPTRVLTMAGLVAITYLLTRPRMVRATRA